MEKHGQGVRDLQLRERQLAWLLVLLRLGDAEQQLPTRLNSPPRRRSRLGLPPQQPHAVLELQWSVPRVQQSLDRPPAIHAAAKRRLQHRRRRLPCQSASRRQAAGTLRPHPCRTSTRELTLPHRAHASQHAQPPPRNEAPVSQGPGMYRPVSRSVVAAAYKGSRRLLKCRRIRHQHSTRPAQSMPSRTAMLPQARSARQMLRRRRRLRRPRLQQCLTASLQPPVAPGVRSYQHSCPLSATSPAPSCWRQISHRSGRTAHCPVRRL